MTYKPILNFRFSTLHKIGLPSDGSFGQSPQKGLILESNARKLLYGSCKSLFLSIAEMGYSDYLCTDVVTLRHFIRK